MFINKPSPVLQIASDRDGITEDGTHYLLGMRRIRSRNLLENRDAVPTPENYSEAAEYLSEITELDIDANMTAAILSLYPQARIDLALCNGLADSGVREGLSFAASHFFLGCDWPTYGEHVDVAAFVELLKRQGELMGFVRRTFV